MRMRPVQELLVSVSRLNVSYRDGDGWTQVLKDVSFDVRRSEIFGLVGESGCGKSTLSYHLLGFHRPGTRVDSGAVHFKGESVLTLGRAELDQLRGRGIGFVPQNPTTSLNPGMRVGEQIGEMLAAHWKGADRKAHTDRILEVLDLVGLPNPREIQHRYPHQLSGGQQQRVTIAMAVACEPELLVLDEPTTGLDVTTQQRIVSLLVDLRSRLRVAMVYVTHDLALLAQMADRVGVMYAGRMVEVAPSHVIFSGPRHPYTRALISSVPCIDQGEERPSGRLRGVLRRRELPAGCPFQPRCDFATPDCATVAPEQTAVGPDHVVACSRIREVDLEARRAEPVVSGGARLVGAEDLLALEDVTISYRKPLHALLGRFRAAEAVRPTVPPISFSIRRGEIFALVGESGSGKSTIARAISGLIRPESGRIRFEGADLAGEVNRRSGDLRREIQFIFQNPDASLNPRKHIGAILDRQIRFFYPDAPRDNREVIVRALNDVRLDASYADRYPNQLSGGERQRVAIARALAVNPKLVLCDEVLSALDVSVQASIIDLLVRLREEHNVAMLFISHDLAVVRNIADRVGVLYHGQLMQIASTRDLFSPPYHPYTRVLLSAVPYITRRYTSDRRGGQVKETSMGPSASRGCTFAGRCPWQLGKVCESSVPPARPTEGGGHIKCHIPVERLRDLV